MKPGSRALGIAESFRRDADHSTVAGVVTRTSRVVDGVAFSTATVGGTDVTEAVVDVFSKLDREDIQYLLVGGIALSWYNVVDLRAVADTTDLPVLSVTFEASDGLEEPLRAAFEGQELTERLETYRNQPERYRVTVGDEVVYVRSVGIDVGRARDVVRGFTPEGGRPEPVRVARLAARGADDLHDG
jgi:endonuclease V-like protein UPF0215 family